MCQFPHASRNAFASKLLTTQQMSRSLALLSPMSYERLSWSRRGQPQSYSSHGVAASDRRLIDERAGCSRRCMTAVALTELDFVVNPSKLQPGLYRLSPGCFICIQKLRTRFSEDKAGCLCGDGRGESWTCGGSSSWEDLQSGRLEALIAFNSWPTHTLQYVVKSLNPARTCNARVCIWVLNLPARHLKPSGSCATNLTSTPQKVPVLAMAR